MNGGKNTLHIVIGCDTDPDRWSLVDSAAGDGLSWRGMSEGIPVLKKLVEDLKDIDGRAPVFTWLLRVDEQIRIMYGGYEWVLEKYPRLLLDLESTGDELGWHPHFFRSDEKGKNWYQETDDLDWQTTMLQQAHEAYMDVFPGRARSVRMGWDYHNNATMRKLDELGVRVDFSAIPGLATKASSPGKKGHNLYDWYISPRKPYYPSKADYRRWATGDEESLSILELPNFASTSYVWGMISGLQFMRKTKDISQIFRAIRRPTYWINLTGKPRLFAPIASELKKNLKKERPSELIFATYFHADELLDNKSPLYDRQSLRINLETIFKLCENEDYAVKFSRAGDVAALIEA